MSGCAVFAFPNLHPKMRTEAEKKLPFSLSLFTWSRIWNFYDMVLWRCAIKAQMSLEPSVWASLCRDWFAFWKACHYKDEKESKLTIQGSVFVSRKWMMTIPSCKTRSFWQHDHGLGPWSSLKVIPKIISSVHEYEYKIGSQFAFQIWKMSTLSDCVSTQRACLNGFFWHMPSW